MALFDKPLYILKYLQASQIVLLISLLENINLEAIVYRKIQNTNTFIKIQISSLKFQNLSMNFPRLSHRMLS